MDCSLPGSSVHGIFQARVLEWGTIATEELTLLNCGVREDSWESHGLQHASLHCPSPTPRVQTHVHQVSDAVQPSHPLSPPSPAFSLAQHRVFSNESVLHIRWPNIGVSASPSVLLMNIQDWFPLGWTGWISLRFKELSRVFSTPQVKASILQHSAFFIVQISHPYMTTGNTIALTRQTFVGKVMSLLFNMLFRY